ncbi:MAG: DUF819 domain-containing protein [Lewinella sp.]|uniref:DUF819 family protein n=1 Tax=Lewinella sp. TaxID=2004506 RepID=UPI003D6BF8E6
MQAPLAILAVLALNIVISEWLNRHTVLRYLGTTLLVILLTAVVANLGIIPSATQGSELYDGIFHYVAPISIFFLLLGVNLGELKKAGLPMLLMFVIGSLCTAIGAVFAVWLVGGGSALGESYRALAGMMTGTYTGGSVNFNAIAIEYNMMAEGNLYAGTVAVDNILTAIWMIATLLIPKLLQGWWPRSQLSGHQELTAEEITAIQSEDENIDPMQLGLLLALGAGTLWASEALTDLLASYGVAIPSILILTTIALVLAQISTIQKISGAKLLGLFFVYLFLAVIGAFCELAALGEIGEMALTITIFTTTIVLVHGLLIYLFGGVLKQDWDLVSIASQANVGGASSAMALAKSLNRTDLILPSILVGTLGSGLGTYIGFFVAEVVL